MRIDTAAASTSAESRESALAVDSSLLAISPGPADLGRGSVRGLPGPADPAGQRDTARHTISRLSIAEGGLALTVFYALIGAGIGALAGSFLLGLIVGFATGVAAIGAILLISGASVVPERSVERVAASFSWQAFRS